MGNIHPRKFCKTAKEEEREGKGRMGLSGGLVKKEKAYCGIWSCLFFFLVGYLLSDSWFKACGWEETQQYVSQSGRAKENKVYRPLGLGCPLVEMEAKLSEGCLITSMPRNSVLSGLEMAGVEGLGRGAGRGLASQGINFLLTRGCKEVIWLYLYLS